MICKACIEAAANDEQGEEAHKARGCKGCTCMHRVGSLEHLYNPETVAKIRAARAANNPEG